MVTTFTYRPSLVRIDAHNFELSWKQIHKHTHTNPHTGPITIHCTAKLSVQFKKKPRLRDRTDGAWFSCLLGKEAVSIFQLWSLHVIAETWKCRYLFATVDAVVSKHRQATCRHPYAGQRIGIDLIEFNQALTFLVLNTSYNTRIALSKAHTSAKAAVAKLLRLDERQVINQCVHGRQLLCCTASGLCTSHVPGLLPVSAASPSMDHEQGTVCQPILEHQIRISAPSSVISRPTCFSSSLRCCWQVG